MQFCQACIIIAISFFLPACSMNQNPPILSRLRSAWLPATALACGALLPALAHAGNGRAPEAGLGGWLPLGIGLLLLLLRPRAPQPGYELFAQEPARQAPPPAVQQARPQDYRPQRAQAPLAA